MTGHSILIIDDDDLLCDMVASLLELEGYRVTLAHEGHAGLQALARETFDLILLDLVMPKMDGIQFMRTVHADMPGHPPIVVMSASVSAKIVEQGRGYGVTGMIRKPVDPQLLAETVRATIAATHG
ncbi:response regulator [Qipengyuania marisflavi]|uniref:Response regulator n=1 Tax=Qipengyuania marisflavi TaxID=2486356 RepID=A0A5S3P5G4_9SPHN|nr:response regulator [Qipengyuania marisflavi]TMM48194.1 response regulator [Qipengyuania marisflavi]